MTTPSRAQIIDFIQNHPGTTTVELVSSFEDPSDKIRYVRAYRCVWIKLMKLSDRGEIVRQSTGARRDGTHWMINGENNAA